MAKKTLVIDGDRHHFFLALEADTLHVGDTSAHPEGTLKGLRIVRVHCEIEIEEDRDSVPIEQDGVIAPRILHTGAATRLGDAQVALVSAGSAASMSDSSVVPLLREPATSFDVPPAAAGPRRLMVTDGGNQGQSFPLPETGTVTLGKVGGPADIGLDDLYVAKTHCTLRIEGGTITVTHVEGTSGTLINGQKLNGPQTLSPGAVLRVGNSHLRLEVGPFPDEPPTPIGPGGSRGPGSAVMRALASEPKSESPRSNDPLAALEGQTLGQYQLGRFISRGFVGAVFRATNTRTGQAAALKVLADEFPAAPAELEQFAQELKVIQAVRHPNLVALLGAGKTATHCWIAREFVEGESAADVIARIAKGEKPSWTRAAQVTVHLARVLDALHQRRLVHGNITPRNVLLQTSDHAARLNDLWLAQALKGSRLQKAILEQKLLAELSYLAPEQAEPGAFVDDLADLYALGALAYALIVGRPPVSGKTPAEILEQIMAGRVSRPGLVYKKVPGAFDGIVMKLLARHQEDRYQTAADLLADLEPLAQHYDLKL